jgi:HEAT repeat protein
MPFRVRAGLPLLFLLLCSLCFGADNPPPMSPRDRSWEALSEGLKEEKSSNRLEAVKALSLVSGERRAIRYAIRALQDKNSNVRTAAAATLGDLRATTAIPDLKEALGDKNISVVLAATHSLFLLKDKSAYAIYYAILMGDKKASEGMVQAQLDRLKDPKQVAMMGVEEGLGFVPFGGMGVGAYKAISKHDNSPVRAAAARFLAEDPDSISEDALVQTALADKNQIVRQAALDALAQRRNPKCIEMLMKNLDDDKDVIRYRTAAVIIHLSRAGASKSKTKTGDKSSPLQRSRPAAGESKTDGSGK